MRPASAASKAASLAKDSGSTNAVLDALAQRPALLKVARIIARVSARGASRRPSQW